MEGEIEEREQLISSMNFRECSYYNLATLFRGWDNLRTR